jgi:hypothetical protein
MVSSNSNIPYFTMVILTFSSTDSVKHLLHRLTPEYGLKKNASRLPQTSQTILLVTVLAATANFLAEHRGRPHVYASLLNAITAPLGALDQTLILASPVPKAFNIVTSANTALVKTRLA